MALALGLGLSQAVVYFSTGWRDGFMDPGLWSFKRHCFRWLPVTLALSALVGAGLEGLHRRWLGRSPGTPAGGWVPFLAALRAFFHFPFYGFIVLFQFLWMLIRAFLPPYKKGRAPFEEGMMASTALWMMLGPFEGNPDEDGRKLTFSFRPVALLDRAFKLFPWLLLVLWVWVGAESEDSGERVEAFLLSLAGAVWLGDFLLLAWMSRPPTARSRV